MSESDVQVGHHGHVLIGLVRQMGTLLKGLARVPWGDLSDTQGSARDIPGLLSRAAWGDDETARRAVEEIGERICALGFVVSEATPYTVPFLLELVDGIDTREPQRQVDVLDLLLSIVTARQWSAVAEASDPRYGSDYAQQVGWEQASHEAVLTGRRLIEELAVSVHPPIVEAAASLLRAFEEKEDRERRAEVGREWGKER